MEKDYLRVNVAAVSTNQHALDFTENKRRIFRSIEMCKSIGVAYRAGGELEVSGYSCDDHLAAHFDQLIVGFGLLGDPHTMTLLNRC